MAKPLEERIQIATDRVISQLRAPGDRPERIILTSHDHSEALLVALEGKFNPVNEEQKAIKGYSPKIVIDNKEKSGYVIEVESYLKTVH